MARRLAAALVIMLVVLAVPAYRPAAQVPRPPAGQSATQLPDGRWLLIGGERAPADAAIWDPATGVTRAVDGHLTTPRAWHSATVLSDGSVLVTGGRNGAVLADTPELFEPGLGRFIPIPIGGAIPRAEHTATLLTDGRVLIAGGTNGAGALGPEVWDIETHTATAFGNAVDRIAHDARLQADGRVLLTGGRSIQGGAPPVGTIVDVDARAVQPAPQVSPTDIPPSIAGSIPANGSRDVVVPSRLAVRFSAPLAIENLTTSTVRLRGPEGLVDTRVIAAEGGRLVFIWPATLLADGATYTLAIEGAADPNGRSMQARSITFTTARLDSLSADPVDPEGWAPDLNDLRDGWRSNRPPSPWESMPPLIAAGGATALSGRVLTLDGRPLAGVSLTIEGQRTETDRTGRFLLPVNATTIDEHTLAIDGRTASRGSRRYGFYEARVMVRPGITNVLPFTIWSPRLDTAHEVTIPSPTTQETVVTTPTMPGFELHLPAGTIIRDENGAIVKRLTITPIPLDRSPFPLPSDALFTMFFTIQPGGAYIHTPGPIKGGWLVYPNRPTLRDGTRVRFFSYDPDDKGWYPYGFGAVTGAQVVPKATTRFYAFTGASYDAGGTPAAGGGTPDVPRKADPVDPSTGAFIMNDRDLSVPDVIPIMAMRTYNGQDSLQRPFGTGMTDPYHLIQHTTDIGNSGDLYLPDGSRIHYVRISPAGTPLLQTVFECQTGPTRFYKSRLAFHMSTQTWEYTLVDGTVIVMGHAAPLQALRDRYGNVTQLTWSQINANGNGFGNLVRVTSPNGRWIQFTYDAAFPTNHVIQATDNIGRTVTYTYDPNGNLSTVTDAEHHVTTYTWDASNRLASITGGRNITYLTNQYDANSRVTQQTLADPSVVYALSYTVDGNNNITQTDITNPRGVVERLAFNADHYIVSDTEAYGTALARTTTLERQVGSDFITAITDALSRRTELTYSSVGRLLSRTHLAGTASAATTTFSYEPIFNQLASLTDPLHHTWTLGYDTLGRLTGITDPVSNQTAIVMNASGQVTSVTDPLSHQWQFGYIGGDLAVTTDPLNTVTTRFTDAGGRLLSLTDGMGRVTRAAFDNLNRPTATIDPLGGQTSINFDANGNFAGLADPLGHVTTYAYDIFDRLATRTDPLQHSESYGYDLNGNQTQTIDRKGQINTSQFDSLDRLSQLTFNDGSTINYFYDAANRVTQITDSINGTISRVYDGLDRLTEVVTQDGTIDYTYDADGRRTSMTISGQSAITYAYDDAHRMTTITQSTSVTTLGYDAADRRTSLTYPSGILCTYNYDSANRVIGLTYTLGQAQLGSITYVYDKLGNPTAVGGTWARVAIPATVTSATYDAANRLVTWAGIQYSYDLNGNLTADGSMAYSWNARNQLSAISGAASESFTYDGLNLRRSKTVNGTVTRFLYDGLNIVQELSSSGTPVSNELTGFRVDELFRRTDNDGAREVLVDVVGSTYELADSSGALLTHYTYEPFGRTTLSGSASANPVQFAGRENDGNSVYFYRARYYSVANGRFVSEDPVGLGGGVNLWLYASDAPTVFIDPLGWKPTQRCDLVCQMAGDIGRRAGPIASPTNIAEFLAASAIAGAAADVLIGDLPPPGVNIHIDPPGTHTFPDGGKYGHIQIDIWMRGIPGSDIHIRIPISGGISQR